jgi:uncharacterized protein
VVPESIVGETMRRALAVASLALCAAWPALAVTTGIPATGLPTATDYAATLLPERAGVVSWRTLAQVEMVQKGIRLVPAFSRDIQSLDARDVKLQGFIIPLEAGEAQRRFLISAVPAECPFCMPAGPEGLVEVVAKTPIRFGAAPIVVAGRFAVLKEDGGGLLYRLTDAVAVDGAPPAAPAAAKPKP